MPIQLSNDFMMRMGLKMKGNRNFSKLTIHPNENPTTIFFKFAGMRPLKKSKELTENCPWSTTPKTTQKIKKPIRNSLKSIKPTMHSLMNWKNKTTITFYTERWSQAEPTISLKTFLKTDFSISRCPLKKSSSNQSSARDGRKILIVWWRMKIVGKILTMVRQWRHQQFTQMIMDLNQERQW